MNHHDAPQAQVIGHWNYDEGLLVNDLICPVCIDYIPNGEKIVLFKCGHIICRKPTCAKHYIKRHRTDPIRTCPMCRAQIHEVGGYTAVNTKRKGSKENPIVVE